MFFSSRKKSIASSELSCLINWYVLFSWLGPSVIRHYVHSASIAIKYTCPVPNYFARRGKTKWDVNNDQLKRLDNLTKINRGIPSVEQFPECAFILCNVKITHYFVWCSHNSSSFQEKFAPQIQTARWEKHEMMDSLEPRKAIDCGDWTRRNSVSMLTDTILTIRGIVSTTTLPSSYIYPFIVPARTYSRIVNTLGGQRQEHHVVCYANLRLASSITSPHAIDVLRLGTQIARTQRRNGKSSCNCFTEWT